MKKAILLYCALFCSLPMALYAQWSQNPGQPTRVCSKNSIQNNPTSIPDGQGGLFVFWEDSRLQSPQGGNFLLFAQHFAADGSRLFPDSGKMIQTKFSGMQETRAYGISRDRQGNFWISYAALNPGTDSLVICKFDKNTLNPLWTRPKAFAKAGPNLSLITALETKHIPDQDSVIVTWFGTWIGGSNVIGWNRLNHIGQAMLPPNTYFGAGGGPYFMVPNPFGGFYVVQRDGNGAGTGVTARRINKRGAVVWGPQSITQGTAGLNYALAVQEDGSGGFVMMYISQSDLMTTRWDSTGTPVWTPAHKPVCNLSSNQNLPQVLFSDGFWYVAFIDNRLQNSSTYMQKIDQQGNRMWNPDGRLIFTDGSYLPHPKMTLSSTGNIVVTTRNITQGFVGQMVRPDSTFAWPAPRIICAPEADVPFYENYTLTSGPGGVAFPIWQGFFSRALFIGAVDSSGQVPTSVSEFEEGRESITAYPNPCTDWITLNIPTFTGQEIRLISADGRTFTCPVSRNRDRVTVRLTRLPAGMYALVQGKQTLRFLKRE
jgi:hypothetical protein